MYVYCRWELVARAVGSRLPGSGFRPPGAAAPALLLEGDWPEHVSGAELFSLDSAIDASEAWIDTAASELTETCAADPAFRAASCEPFGEVSLAWLNALALRYYLVKLLRIVAFLERPEAKQIRGIDLTAEQGKDDDYLLLFRELCTARKIELRINLLPSAGKPAAALSCNGLARRAASWLNRSIQARFLARSAVAQQAPSEHAQGQPFEAIRNGGQARYSVCRDSCAYARFESQCPFPRIQSLHCVLCGNPRVLNPVAEELLWRGTRVSWLYDRFAFRAWWKWRGRGVQQLTCDSSQGVRNAFASACMNGEILAQRDPARLSVRGINLGPAIWQWLRRNAWRGPLQTRMLEQIDLHFSRLRPDCLVLGEDATPFSRAAIAIARRWDVRSIVVQHGAPRVRFGFAPLIAERICVWGETSAQQLAGWGVPTSRIHITGSVQQPITASSAPVPACGIRAISANGSPRIVLFATVPPADHRPDAVSYHLTTKTHADLIRIACAAVSAIQGELLIKLHPRCRDRHVFHDIAKGFAGLRYRIIAGGDLVACVRGAACVLNCGSSAGIELASAVLPVIELVPWGSVELTPARSWGLFGAARSLPELQVMLTNALSRQSPTPASRRVFWDVGQEAAAAVADVIQSSCAKAAYAGEPRTQISEAA